MWEALPVPGGVASSCRVKDGSVLLNDQVSGAFRQKLLCGAGIGLASRDVDVGDAQPVPCSIALLTVASCIFLPR